MWIYLLYREIKLWDFKKMSQPTAQIVVDQASGVVNPFYDMDTGIYYLSGKVRLQFII
jgi:hypothetical protein